MYEKKKLTITPVFEKHYAEEADGPILHVEQISETGPPHHM